MTPTEGKGNSAKALKNYAGTLESISAKACLNTDLTTMTYPHVSHINYGESTTDIESVDIEPLGDARKEVEAAAKRYFGRETGMVRATLVAAGVADLNPKHGHAATYQNLAEDIDVTREIVTKAHGLEYVRVTIED